MIPEIDIKKERCQMDKLSLDRALELVKIYLQSLGTWEFINDKWAIVGLREVKVFFGLLHHSCPLCQAEMSYHTIICQARDAGGQLVGKPLPLPLYTDDGGFLPGVLIPQPGRNLQFGVCCNGHETARIYVNHGGGDGFYGYLIHQFQANKMVQIACP